MQGAVFVAKFEKGSTLQFVCSLGNFSPPIMAGFQEHGHLQQPSSLCLFHMHRLLSYLLLVHYHHYNKVLIAIRHIISHCQSSKLTRIYRGVNILICQCSIIPDSLGKLTRIHEVANILKRHCSILDSLGKPTRIHEEANIPICQCIILDSLGKLTRIHKGANILICQCSILDSLGILTRIHQGANILESLCSIPDSLTLNYSNCKTCEATWGHLEVTILNCHSSISDSLRIKKSHCNGNYTWRHL